MPNQLASTMTVREIARQVAEAIDALNRPDPRRRGADGPQ